MMRGGIYSELTFEAVFLGLLNFARANTALVRTERSLSARVRGYLPPHNFAVRPREGCGGSPISYRLEEHQAMPLR